MLMGFTWCIPINRRKQQMLQEPICNMFIQYLVAVQRYSLTMEPNSRMKSLGRATKAWYREADPFTSVQTTIQWKN